MRQIGIGVKVFAVHSHGLACCRNGFLWKTKAPVVQRQVVERSRIARIGVVPLLIHFVFFFNFSGRVAVVVRLDVESLPFAGSFAKVIGFLKEFKTAVGFRQVVVAHSQYRIRHGEIGIKLDGALQMGNGLVVVGS